MRHIYILILFILSCTPEKPEDIVAATFLSECDGPYGYDCQDIETLRHFINLNSQVFRHYMDYNNNGILEPLEFGYQVWNGGRLIQLNLNYNKNVIMQPDNPSEFDTTNYRLTYIPENIGDFLSLESLFLHDNEFSYVPASIGNLTQLKILDLETNLITELPEDIGNLVNLENFVLNFNQITSLPETIGSLVSLGKFWLNNNQLEYLPNSVVNLSQLQWLYLNNNFLKYLPENIGDLENLKFISLDNNMLSVLPNNICEIYPGQWDCEYDSEGMCISPPICITSPKCLESLSIVNNYLCGDGIPSCVNKNFGNQNCSNCDPWEFNIEGYCADSSDYNILQNFLDLNPDAQGQTGIPKNAKECVNEDWWEDGRLVEITFQHKQLYSKIPGNIGNLDKLEIIRLTGNELQGQIPNNIINLNNLKILKLNSNQLSGVLPDDIGALSNLDTLHLSYNNLSGEIPSSITELELLSYFAINDNNFSGSIPENITNLDSLKYIYLMRNQFSGNIPESIGDLEKVQRLYLHSNNLSGEIPVSICNLYDSYEYFKLYLHNNYLCPGELGYPVCIPQDDLGPQDCSR